MVITLFFREEGREGHRVVLEYLVENIIGRYARGFRVGNLGIHSQVNLGVWGNLVTDIVLECI